MSRLLDVVEVADALEKVLRLCGPDLGPLRARFPLSAGTLLVMPAEWEGFAGVKLATVLDAAPTITAPRVGGVYVLFDAPSLATLAIIDAAVLTTLRTAALSVVATRKLARPGWEQLVVFGTGPQARSHVLAMAALQPAVHAFIVGRDDRKAADLAQECRHMGIDAEVGTVERLATADVVCTCTNSPTPLFPGELLPDHAHVNAIGAHTLDTRELDDAAVIRSQLVVESRSIALGEAGDVAIPVRSGVITPEHIMADLPELLSGVSLDRARLTVFKSVGFGLADLVTATAAREALARAR